MIRELSYAISKVNKNQSVVGQTLAQAALIFKKCMLIDEDEFMKVTNIAQGSASVLKGYLSSLGSFVGSMTIAKNEPIRSCQLDLKQILIEGFPTKNRRLAVAFVCRILKESNHSKVFTPRNPWMNTLLCILREIYDYSQPMQNKQHHADNLMEIDSLFKSLNVSNSSDIKPHGIL
jgi:CCR4-NOT transcription complex subunit 1